MFLFILGLLLLAIALVVSLLKYEQGRYGHERVKGPVPYRGVIVPILALLGTFFLVLAFTTVIQAKNVGVLTTFGKPSDRTLNPGLHLKLPWQKVTELDGTIQTDEYKGDDCIYVRIGDGSRSCVTLTNRWRVVPERANTIYGDFRSDNPTESFRAAVVSTQLKSAAQEVMAEYNPIATLEVVEGSNAAAAKDLNFAPDYDQVSQDILASMEERLGDEPLAQIDSITVSYVSLSDSTQKTLDDFIAAVGDTRIAAQRRSTAAEEAAANRALSDSISNDPNVLVSKCLDILADARESGYQMPAGFSCWGESSAVVVPSAPAKQ